MQHGEAEGRREDHIARGDAPARQSMTDQASTPPVTTKTETAWNRRTRSSDAGSRAGRPSRARSCRRAAPARAWRGAEGAHQADIADDVGEVAAHRRGPAGEAVMQMLAPAASGR